MVEESQCINDFINPSHREIAEEMIVSSKEGEISSLKLINKLKEEKLSSLVSSLSLSEEFPQGEGKEQIAADLVAYLQKNTTQRRINELRRRIEEDEKEGGEEEKITEWLDELTKLKKQIMTG